MAIWFLKVLLLLQISGSLPSFPLNHHPKINDLHHCLSIIGKCCTIQRYTRTRWSSTWIASWDPTLNQTPAKHALDLEGGKPFTISSSVLPSPNFHPCPDIGSAQVRFQYQRILQGFDYNVRSSAMAIQGEFWPRHLFLFHVPWPWQSSTYQNTWKMGKWSNLLWIRWLALLGMVVDCPPVCEMLMIMLPQPPNQVSMFN